MQQAKLKVLRNFYQYPAAQLVTFGNNVAVNLDPTKFANLAVAPKDIKAFADDLSAKLAATIIGGRVEIAAKNNAFDVLSDALNSDANTVEVVAANNMELMLGTGYLPASTNRSSSPLDDTSIVSLLNNGTTHVLLQLLPVRNAKTYQVQTSTDGGKTWVEACISTQARRIVIPNLVPGTMYAVRARAIGGSTGASNWTGPGSIMST
jgi:archaellum component FlaG (FlaF/FlaG flagellin family)